MTPDCRLNWHEQFPPLGPPLPKPHRCMPRATPAQWVLTQQPCLTDADRRGISPWREIEQARRRQAAHVDVGFNGA